MLKENLKTVEEHVQEACKRAGRSREEVTLSTQNGRNYLIINVIFI